LNNILEQDHPAIQRRVNAKQEFREFQAARRTIQGYEAMNRLRQGWVRWVGKLMSDVRFDSSTSYSTSPPETEASRPFFARPLLPAPPQSFLHSLVEESVLEVAGTA
jgi:hypothetical protein